MSGCRGRADAHAVKRRSKAEAKAKACPALPCSAVPFPALPCSAVPFPAMPYTALLSKQAHACGAHLTCWPPSRT